MKNLISQLTYLFMATLWLCSCGGKDDNNVPPTPIPPTPTGATASLKVGGTAFTPTTLAAASTGSLLNLSFKNADNAFVNIALSDKTAGSYTVDNTSLQRTLAGNAKVKYIDKNNATYQGKTGTISVSVASDGKLSGTFSFDVQNADGTVLKIEEGKFDKFEITGSSGCKISFAQQENDHDVYLYKFTYEYDLKGRLFKEITAKIKKADNQQVSTNSSVYYYNANNQIIKTEYYEGKKLTANFTPTLEYSSQGKIIKESTADYSNTYEYNSSGNISKITSTSGKNTSTSLYEYDSKGNLIKETSQAYDPDYSLPGQNQNKKGVTSIKTKIYEYDNKETKNGWIGNFESVSPLYEPFGFFKNVLLKATSQQNETGEDGTKYTTIEIDTYTTQLNELGYITNLTKKMEVSSGPPNKIVPDYKTTITFSNTYECQ